MLKKVSDNSVDKVTNVYWQPLQALLDPQTRAQTLPGFDDEFVDIVDYIIRITHRIWEQKNIGDCYRYYADICPVHTLGGYCDTVDVVVQNTLKTIAAFPDRSLIGENVVWRANPDNSFYSSHRITSIMTNKGQSEFGPASHKTGRVTTLADCVCKDNKIVYEWLMRDNSFLIQQLGIDLIDAAKHQASAPVAQEFAAWIKQEYQRVSNNEAMLTAPQGKLEQHYIAVMQKWINELFNLKNFKNVAQLYACNASVQWPGGRSTVGHAGVIGLLTSCLAQCPNAHAVLDHIAVTEFDDDTHDIAIRWSLAGNYHATTSDMQAHQGKPYFILAGSHFRIKQGHIIKEWTVFDEVAALANLFRNQPMI